jgi:hypothetical protein
VISVLVLVTVDDTESAAALVGRLEREVDAAKIGFEAEPRRVRIELKAAPDRNLGLILNVVEAWLGEDGRDQTTVEIDGHSYTLGGVRV